MVSSSEENKCVRKIEFKMQQKSLDEMKSVKVDPPSKVTLIRWQVLVVLEQS